MPRKLKNLWTKKRPWLAAILNALLPGAGYLYVGRRRIFGGFMVVASVLAVIDWRFGPNSLPGEPGLLGNIACPLFLLAFAYDAYREAKMVNLASRRKPAK